MIVFSRITLFFLFFFAFGLAQGQLQIDSHARYAYDSLMKILTDKERHNLDRKSAVKSGMQGLAIFSTYQSDTLNSTPDMATPGADIQMEVKDPVSGEWKLVKQSVRSENDRIILFCDGIVHQDTLFILIHKLFPDEWIEHIITKNAMTSFYGSQLKEYVYKINLDDSLEKSLVIPAQTSVFNISDTSFEKGKTIYGNAEIKTGTYYKINEWSDGKFDKIERTLKYFFRFKISMNE